MDNNTLDNIKENNNKYLDKNEVLKKWISINKRLNKNKDSEYHSRTIIEAQNLVEIILNNIIDRENIQLENRSFLAKFAEVSKHLGINYETRFKDNLYNMKQYRNTSAHNTMTVVQNIIDFTTVQNALNTYGEVLCLLGYLNRDDIVIEIDKLQANEEDIIGGTVVLKKCIGGGASGRVFLAFHQRLGINVAVKELNHNTVNENIFKNEAKILVSLKHNNIPNIYDVIEDNRTYYIVMEYINGINLYEFVNRVGLPSEKAKLNIMLYLCDTVMYLHSRGIIHNDLKPNNIIIDNSNRVFVIDYGISSSKNNKANNNVYSGTKAYSSPIQQNGNSNNSFNDIYALGGILYFLTEGIDPGQGEKSYKKSIDDKIIFIIEKTMNFNESSYGSVAELKNDLLGCINGGVNEGRQANKANGKKKKGLGYKKRNIIIGTSVIVGILIFSLFVGEVIFFIKKDKQMKEEYAANKEEIINNQKDVLNDDYDTSNNSSGDNKAIKAEVADTNDTSNSQVDSNTEGSAFGGKVKISVQNYQIDGGKVTVKIHVENNFGEEIVFWPSKIYLLNESGKTFSLDQHEQLRNEPGEKNVPSGTNKDFNLYFSGYEESVALKLKIDYIWCMGYTKEDNATSINIK